MSDSEEDEEHNEEELAELERARNLAAKRGNQRGSVLCSEPTKTDENWKPPKYDKNSEQRGVITNAVTKSFIFESLRPDVREQVIDAFKGPMEVERATTVIREGTEVGSKDAGLYVLEKGTLEAFKVNPSVPEFKPGALVFTYDQPGQVFGELALLYNCPRAASIIAAADSVLWSLDRETFNNCVKGGNMGVQSKMKDFLGSVEILSGISEADRNKLVDVMQHKDYKPGEHIIKAGEEGSEFFMVMGGKAQAMAKGKAVKDYAAGSYFGELALIKNQPRAVDVVACKPDGASVVILEGGSFRRLLGDVTETLAERAAGYGNVSSKKDEEKETSKAKKEEAKEEKEAKGDKEKEPDSGKGKKKEKAEKTSSSKPESPSNKAAAAQTGSFWGCCNCSKSPDRAKI